MFDGAKDLTPQNKCSETNGVFVSTQINFMVTLESRIGALNLLKILHKTIF